MSFDDVFVTSLSNVCLKYSLEVPVNTLVLSVGPVLELPCVKSSFYTVLLSLEGFVKFSLSPFTFLLTCPYHLG